MTISEFLQKQLPTLSRVRGHGGRWPRSNSWRNSTWWLPDATSSVGVSHLRFLFLAQNMQLPMKQVIACMADDERMTARYRLRKLSGLIDQGTPLLAALEQTPDVISDDDLLALRFGYESGISESVYNWLCTEQPKTASSTRIHLQQVFIYGMGLLICVLAIATFLAVFVTPTLYQIFQEFGLTTPPTLARFVASAQQISQWAFPFAPWLLLVLLLASWIFRPLRVVRRHYASRLFSSVSRFRSARVLQLLSLSLEHGRPIAGAISTLARYHFDPHLRHRLLFARNEIEQGCAPWQSLATAKLMSSKQANALADAKNNEYRAWILQKIAEQELTQLRNRQSIWAIWLHPILMLVFGAIVGFVCVAHFETLTQLINAVGD